MSSSNQSGELKRLLGEHEKDLAKSLGPSAALAEGVEEYAARWQEALERDPSLQQAAAATLLRQKEYAKAAEAFDRLLVKEPENPTLLSGKAIALTGMRRHEDALVILENLARGNPKDVALQFNYAVALMRAGEREPAIRAYRRVLELEPNHARALYNLAVSLQLAGRPAEAMECWKQLASKLEAASSGSSQGMLIDAWSHCGELALELKQPAEAEKCFLRIVELAPRSAQAWCNVGIARAEQIRRGDALTALRIALQLDPKLVQALNQTAYLEAANYRDTGDIKSGRMVVECCRRSLEVEANQPNIRSLLQAVRVFDPTETAERPGSGQ